MGIDGVVATVRLTTGNRVIQVRTDMLRGKSASPQPGETWILDQVTGSSWTFLIPLGYLGIDAVEWQYPDLLGDWVNTSVADPALDLDPPIATWTPTSGTYPLISYCKDAMGWVTLRGTGTGPVANSGQPGPVSSDIFQLDDSCYPSTDGLLRFVVAEDDGTGTVMVRPDGYVRAVAGSGINLSLDGIRFRANPTPDLTAYFGTRVVKLTARGIVVSGTSTDSGGGTDGGQTDPGGHATVTNWVGTCNIGRDKTYAARVQSINNVADSHTNAIWGFQEIDEGDTGDEWAAMVAAFPSTYQFAHDNPTKYEPVAVPPTWRIAKHVSYFAHPGMAHVTPARYIGVTTLVHQTTGIQYSHVDSHPVNGAFTHPGQRVESLRRIWWNEWWDKLTQIVADLVSTGHTVIFTSDTNNPHLPKIHPNEERYVHGVLDYVIGVQPNNPDVTITKLAVDKIVLNIDGHAAWAVQILFRQT